MKTWKPGDITCVIMTVNRKPSYIHQTMASMFAADALVHKLKRIYLMVGSDDASYLQDFAHHKNFTIVPMETSEWSRAREMPIHQRACHNYHRCLTVPMRNSRGLLVCEDDVIFRDGFLKKLLQSLNEMRADGIHDAILAGYAAYNFDDDSSFRRGRFYSSYPAHWFYGTQFVLYTKTVLPAIAKCVRLCGVEKYEEPYDLLVNRYATKEQNLYATRFSIAQHIGAITTGLGYFVQTPTFGIRWPGDSER